MTRLETRGGESTNCPQGVVKRGQTDRHRLRTIAKETQTLDSSFGGRMREGEEREKAAQAAPIR